jgi:hypothetical protein
MRTRGAILTQNFKRIPAAHSVSPFTVTALKRLAGSSCPLDAMVSLVARLRSAKSSFFSRPGDEV